MAHKQQLEFIKMVSSYLSDNYKNKSIIELGSYDVNGSIRGFFLNSEYTGVDLTDGPGVDVVADAHSLDYPENSFDISISCESFEHNPMWLETFKNMHRITKEGGVLILTCASRGRIEHGTTRTAAMHSPGTQAMGWNYYRNLVEKDFTSQIVMNDLFKNYFFYYNKYSSDLYLVAIKSGKNNIFEFDLGSLKKECAESAKLIYRQEFSLFTRIRKFTFGLPIYFASFLQETQFQNFAISYKKLIGKIKK